MVWNCEACELTDTHTATNQTPQQQGHVYSANDAHDITNANQDSKQKVFEFRTFIVRNLKESGNRRL